ncbi:MAG TPA: hypothetical protein VGF17_18955 [Phytomonospora sp.]
MTGIAARQDSSPDPLYARSPADARTTVASPAAARALAIARIALGWIFLWAFLDKLFGFGHPTPTGKGWLDGGSPTAGYLSGVDGPFGGLFTSMSGLPAADWLFMGGMAGLGVSLVLGIGMRVAAIGGVLLLGSLWASSLPIAANLFLDQHLVYLLTIIGLTFARAGDTWGLGLWWSRTALVRKVPVLR